MESLISLNKGPAGGSTSLGGIGLPETRHDSCVLLCELPYFSGSGFPNPADNVTQCAHLENATPSSQTWKPKTALVCSPKAQAGDSAALSRGKDGAGGLGLLYVLPRGVGPTCLLKAKVPVALPFGRSISNPTTPPTSCLHLCPAVSCCGVSQSDL